MRLVNGNLTEAKSLVSSGRPHQILLKPLNIQFQELILHNSTINFFFMRLNETTGVVVYYVKILPATPESHMDCCTSYTASCSSR